MAQRLTAEGLVTGVSRDELSAALKSAIIDDFSVEDRLNDEVRELLAPFMDQMRQTGVDYHEAFKKAKARLARERKLTL